MKNLECPSSVDLIAGLIAGEDEAIRHRERCRACRVVAREVAAVGVLLRHADESTFSTQERGPCPDRPAQGGRLGGFVKVAAAITLTMSLGLLIRGLEPVATGSWSLRGVDSSRELKVQVRHHEGEMELIIKPEAGADRYELHLTRPSGERVLATASEEPRLLLRAPGGYGAILWHVEAWRGLEKIGASSARPMPQRP